MGLVTSAWPLGRSIQMYPFRCKMHMPFDLAVQLLGVDSQNARMCMQTCIQGDFLNRFIQFNKMLEKLSMFINKDVAELNTWWSFRVMECGTICTIKKNEVDLSVLLDFYGILSV